MTAALARQCRRALHVRGRTGSPDDTLMLAAYKQQAACIAEGLEVGLAFRLVITCRVQDILMERGLVPDGGTSLSSGAKNNGEQAGSRRDQMNTIPAHRQALRQPAKAA